MRGKDMPYLIALALIALPFIWLYKTIGPLGFWMLLLAAAGAIGYWALSAGKRERAKFQELALFALNNRTTPDEGKAMIRPLLRKDHNRASLIRSLQIIRDSIDIALSSKKKDVAESRMELVLKHYREIKQAYTYLLDPGTMGTVEKTIAEAELQFQTNLYINTALGLIEKAEKLKTDKSRQKYRSQAIEILMEGMSNPRSSKETLNSMLRKHSLDTRVA